jgi:catechol 2,3-dioxygenase-like lactoylglutathione lyase family enzyme
VREAEVHGPDHLILTLLQVDKRRPSLLDAEPDRLHSEVHSFVYSVREADRCIAFWQACGLKKVTDAPFGGTTLAIALGLPPREIRSRFVVFVDEADKPVRVQLLEFLGEGGELIPDWPLAGGLHAVAFEVEELEAACAALPTARFGDVVEYESAILGRARAVTGVGPGDQRFQIWQRQ